MNRARSVALVLLILATGGDLTWRMTSPADPGPLGVCVDSSEGMTGVETPTIAAGVISCRDGHYVSAVPDRPRT